MPSPDAAIYDIASAEWFEIEKCARTKDVSGYAALRLVDYVQDRDLWRWALADSREWHRDRRFATGAWGDFSDWLRLAR